MKKLKKIKETITKDFKNNELNKNIIFIVFLKQKHI